MLLWNERGPVSEYCLSRAYEARWQVSLNFDAHFEFYEGVRVNTCSFNVRKNNHWYM